MRIIRIVILIVGSLWIVFGPARTLLNLSGAQTQNADAATSITEGKFISFDGSNHATAVCEYWVDGVRYLKQASGMSSSDVGKSVEVHYNPNNPAQGYTGRPPQSFYHNLIGVTIVAVFLFVGLLVIVLGSRRFRPNAN